MYSTGLDPFTGEEVYIARHLRDRKLQRALDWTPEVPAVQGVSQLVSWVQDNRAAFAPKSSGGGSVFPAQDHVRDQPGAALAQE